MQTVPGNIIAGDSGRFGGLTPRTQAFINATLITNPVIINALNTFDKGLIFYNLYLLIRALYPFVGGTSFTHKFNFMNPLDADAAFRLLFNGSNTHNANGYIPNGVNGYAETFFNPVAQGLSLSSAHLITYQNVISDTGTSRAKIGADDGAALNMFGLAIYNAGTQEMGCIGGTTTAEYAPNAASPAANGFTCIATNGSRSAQHYKGSAANGAPSLQTGSFPNRQLFIGATNRSGSPMTFFNKPICLTSIGDGLTPTQVSNYKMLIENLQIALSRA